MNENKQYYKFSIQSALLISFTIIVVASSAIFTVLLVQYRTKDLIDLVDSKLLTAAEFSREMLGSNYHDRIADERSVSKEEFRKIVARNDDLCRRLNIQYLWSVLLVDNRLVFTSATHSSLNDPNSPCASFFETHRDPASFASVMGQELKTSFSSFKNEWGNGRQVLIPRKDVLGRTYIFGASVQLNEIDSMIRSTIISSCIIGLAIIFCTFLLTLVLTRIFTQPIARLSVAANRIATGDFDVPLIDISTRELESLSFSLDQMQQGLKRFTAELLEGREIFNQFMQHSPIYVFFKDVEMRSIRLSTNYEKLLGKPMSELLGKSMMDIFPSDFAKKIVADDQLILSEGKGVVLDEELNGRYYSTIKFPFQIADKTKYLAGFTIDVTERKLAEEKIRSLLAEKELLLQEVHHRIKNNMNTIKGLLTLQLSAEDNPKVMASIKDAENRVQSMIMLYDRLYCTENYRELSVKDYLERLAEEIAGSFPNRGIVKIETEIDDFILNVTILAPLGIIVNELFTNMMKYAFTERENGVIRFSVGIKDNSVKIVIQDNGIGIPESVMFKRSAGFGLNLVDMLTEQIGGRIKIERGEGTKFVLEFEI